MIIFLWMNRVVFVWSCLNRNISDCNNQTVVLQLVLGWTSVIFSCVCKFATIMYPKAICKPCLSSLFCCMVIYTSWSWHTNHVWFRCTSLIELFSLLVFFFSVYSLAPLVKKISEDRILEMANKLCDKLLNGKDQHRDIASIALKTIVSEVNTTSLAQRILASLGPQLIEGITNPVSFL